MKKVIEYLTNFLCGDSEDNVDLSKGKFRYMRFFDGSIVKGLQRYAVFERRLSKCYAVYMIISTNSCDYKGIVKAFPFGDDKEYARLCAEELCEKLNEIID